MNRNRKMNFLLLIAFTIALVMIPDLLINNQRYVKVFIGEKNINQVDTPQPPKKSSVYYENTTGTK